MSENRLIGYALWTLFLKSLSINLALAALGVRGVASFAGVVLIILPYVLPKAATIILCIYDFIRPILYIIALIHVIRGVQDIIAIAFYVIFALQVFSMIRNLINTIALLVEYRNSTK